MRFRLLSALVAALSLSACLSSVEPIVIPTIETTGFDPSLGVNLSASTKTADGLYYRDIQVGTGALVAAGDSVGVYYVGALPTGSVFDSRLPAADSSVTPYGVRVGALRLIPGFEEGLVGMAVGGKRQLIIPPQLGYWQYARIDQNGNTLIPAYSILVFTVTAAAKY